MIKFVIALLICLFFIGMDGGRLVHGGIFLIDEGKADAVEIQGEISDIKGLGRFSFPEMKTEYGYGETNGVQLMIDGVPCTASTKGPFEVGDYVRVVYLPKSGYILSISK